MIDMCCVGSVREISLTVLLVNSHDVTGRIFRPVISRQIGVKRPLKWDNN